MLESDFNFFQNQTKSNLHSNLSPLRVIQQRRWTSNMIKAFSKNMVFSTFHLIYITEIPHFSAGRALEAPDIRKYSVWVFSRGILKFETKLLTVFHVIIIQ